MKRSWRLKRVVAAIATAIAVVAMAVPASAGAATAPGGVQPAHSVTICVHGYCVTIEF